MFIKSLPVPLLLMLWAFRSSCASAPAPADTDTPRIVNIVNFIRLLEPRDSGITEDVLYQTVVRQLATMRKYRLGGTFLLQYDALMDPRYQALLRSLPRDSFEIGAWWELPQPLVEKAGLKWRGRYPWDWRANVGFVTGYTPAERYRLIDVYMRDFRQIFGYYPHSVGSWFIDAHSLQYMYEKYGIVASCNCKDQYGTDGYTLWGGYWNQAYYPSIHNAYMPAQHENSQVPVPVFRMLGSDPIRQYDNGLGAARQGVVTLEPVYPFGGGDSAWVHWFFSSLVEDPALGFNYTQAGQENSFTWAAMEKGFDIQMPLIAQLRDRHKLRVETLGTTGRWFRSRYKLTPATSFTVSHDLPGSDRSTVWFDSRFYRINFLWEKGALRIRDIHLFNEDFPSLYETQPAAANDCQFFTLPFVDGYLWSKAGQRAGLRFRAVIDGKDSILEGGEPVFTLTGPAAMHISWPLRTVAGRLEIELREDRMEIHTTGAPGPGTTSAPSLDWFLELTTAPGVSLPFDAIDPGSVHCSFEKMHYSVRAGRGEFSRPGDAAVLRIRPRDNSIVLLF